jgi:RNA polymerase sigma-70 factor (sigma-E family)
LRRRRVVEPPGLAFAVATWTDIYRAERDGLVRLAYLMTGSQAVAEDLVQDTFVRVMARLDPSSSPGAYLRRSVINACYSWHRRAWREVRPGDRDGEPRPGGNRDEGGDVDMWDALNRLAPRRRSILVMRYYLDMSEADVAATLGCRVGTVKSTTHRALADLRKMIER